MGIIGSEPRGKQKIQDTPAPNNYSIITPKESPKISIAAKRSLIQKTEFYPGPGQYQIVDRKNKKGILIGRQHRFTEKSLEKYDRPGPGTYSIDRPNSATISFTRAPRMSHKE